MLNASVISRICMGSQAWGVCTESTVFYSVYASKMKSPNAWLSKSKKVRLKKTAKWGAKPTLLFLK